jgi:hypothetical protein
MPTPGVWRIVQRVNLSRLPASQRYKRHDRKWKRYEKPRPGHAVQVDVKFIAPLPDQSRKKYYQFTAIDDRTRIRVLRIYEQLNPKTAIQPTTCWTSCRSGSTRSRQTFNGSDSSRRSTATRWIAGFATSTSSPPPRG